MLFHVVYVSAATRLFEKDDLVALMKNSAERNTRVGITGLLLYKDGNIIQVLEGPEAEVRETFARIERDPRHRHVQILLQEPIEERCFPRWAMSFRDLRSAEVRALPGFHEFLNTPFERFLNPSMSQKLLNVFKETL